MSDLRRIRSVIVAAAMIVASCKDSPATPEAGATATASASASVASAAPRGSLPPPMPTIVDAGPNRAHGCTAIGVKGTVAEADAGVISDAMKIEGKTITLGDASKVTVKGVSSGKEIAFVGPASAIACRGGDEDEHWLFAGAVEAGLGGGLGAETWIVVPGFAVVRFSGSAFRAEIAKDALSLTVQSGVAYVLPIGAPPPADAGLVVDPAGFFRLDAGRMISVPKGVAVAKTAVDRCVSAANDARLLAAALVAPDAAVGDLAAKHVDARKKARALCTVALASPGLDPKDRTRAEAADTSWRVVLTP